jgi:hypothetical protein
MFKGVSLASRETNKQRVDLVPALTLVDASTQTWPCGTSERPKQKCLCVFDGPLV